MGLDISEIGEIVIFTKLVEIGEIRFFLWLVGSEVHIQRAEELILFVQLRLLLGGGFLGLEGGLHLLFLILGCGSRRHLIGRVLVCGEIELVESVVEI